MTFEEAFTIAITEMETCKRSAAFMALGGIISYNDASIIIERLDKKIEAMHINKAAAQLLKGIGE